jgi:hypothetical protein
MISFKKIFESIIDAEYWNQIHKSPHFLKINRMKKVDLISALGRKLWFQTGKRSRIMDDEKVIANRKYSQREMAYLLYTIEWNDAKVPEI